MKPLLCHINYSLLNLTFIMLAPLAAAETKTSTQISQANNLASKDCGVVLSVPDFLERNVNDDQVATDLTNYEKWDRDHVPSPAEKDLKEVTLSAKTGTDGGVLTLTVRGIVAAITCPVSGSTDTIYWSDTNKNNRYPQANHTTLTWTIPGSNPNFSVVLYIEGVETSAAPADIKFVAELTCPGKTPIPATGETAVYEVDLDVDSENNNNLERKDFTQSEDEIEASEKSPKKPGKYIWVNAGFSANDNDGTPGWADGFDSNPADTEDNESRDFAFTPVSIELKEPFDPANAVITITYSASNPANVTSLPGNGTPEHSFTYTLPPEQAEHPENLRLWTKDCAGSRVSTAVTSNGNFIPNGVPIPWSKLASGKTAELFIEAVRPSKTLGDTTIEISVTGNGATCKDKVNVTCVYFKEAQLILETPATGYKIDDQIQALSNDPLKVLTNTGGYTITYQYGAKFDPDTVDPALWPVNDFKIGMMQNVISSTRVGYYGSPTITWAAGLNQGVYVDVDSSFTLVKQLPVDKRYNDHYTDVGAFPIYSLSEQLAKVDGVLASTDDSPLLPYLATIKEFNVKGDVFYSFTKSILSDHFVCWTCGRSSSTSQIYPLLENKWDLAIDSTLPNLSATVQSIESTLPTLVPTRMPIANEEIKDINEIRSNSGTTRLTK